MHQTTKLLFSLLALTLVALVPVGNTMAQNPVIARFMFEDAEAAYAKKDYVTTLAKLEEAEQEFGKINPPILYLRIMARHGSLITKEDFDTIERLREETARYLRDYGELESVRDHAREVYQVFTKLRKYPATRAEYAEYAKHESELRERLRPGRSFRDSLGVGGEGPEMVVIPTGSFMMGSQPGEAGRKNSEGPQHKVTIARSFAIGRYEVTVGDFGRFVAATAYRTDAERNVGRKGCVTEKNGKMQYLEGSSWLATGFRQEVNEPVTCVSWNDAIAYADWLSTQTGKRYRLPTEAEWEYAARAGTQTAYYWGDDPDQTCRHVNLFDQALKRKSPEWAAVSCDDGVIYTAEVGRYMPNAFGLHDMFGNVFEWVEDCWHENYEGAPTDGSAWTRGDDCGKRVKRGGTWLALLPGVRSAGRDWGSAAARSYISGFRLAQDL